MATPTYLANGTQTQYKLLSNVSSNGTGTLNTVNSITIPPGGGGVNYNYVPEVVISGGGGYGAEAVAAINGSGSVTSITVTNQGIGYTSTPTVTIRGAGSIGTIVIANSGGGYSNTPTVLISSPNQSNGQQAYAVVGLAQNSIANVLITNTGTGYTTPPTIQVNAAQNNYPSYQAQLTAILNTGTGAVGIANILPYYTGESIEGGSYYLRNLSTQTVMWDLAVAPAFTGNIYLQGSLSPSSAGADWFDIKKLNLANSTANASNVVGQETINGKFKWLRARVEDFAQGTINTLTITYPYVG